MASRVPHALSAYLQLPPELSVTLLTSVLGASSNWLTVRFLCAVLGSQIRSRGSAPRQDNEVIAEIAPEASHDDVAVVFVSWMREYAFWQQEARRAGGLDLKQQQQEDRFIFVDGLSKLFGPLGSSSNVGTGKRLLQTSTSQPPSGPLPTRTHPTHSSLSTPASTSAPQHTSKGYVELTSPDITHTESRIIYAVSSLRKTSPNRRIVLILDSPSLLLHTTHPPIKSSQLTNMLLHLRAQVHSSVVALPADGPLLQAATDQQGPPPTPLEADGAAFLMGLAHQARMIMACRQLDTGWAEDVSGVLRVTRGGAAEEDQGNSSEGTTSESAGIGHGKSTNGIEEGEWLYYNGGDGTVKIWTRGSSH